MHIVVHALPLALLLLLGGVSAEGDVKPEEVVRGGGGGGGWSQQYHYSAHPGEGGTYAGLSFDLSTGLFLAIGAIIILLAFAAVCYPLLSKGGGDGGWGSSYGSYRSLQSVSEKVLNGLDKAFELYNKKA